MGPRNAEKNGFREVISGKLYFAVLHRPEDLKSSWLPAPAICFSIDNELVYEPFYADFGPLNLACTYRFCWKLNDLLKEGEMQGSYVCFYCSSDPKKKANAAVLLGAYLVLFEGMDAEAAYAPLADFEPHLPFRDPTCGISTYHLSVFDCIRAVAKAKKIGWIDFNNFNVEEYEYFEQAENGDLNWIVPNKLVAFSGPGARRSEIRGYRTLVPEDYLEYFKQSGVTAVIRLNKRLYDKRRFTENGISHYDLYFPDGSCPPERIVQHFLEIVEDNRGAVAVHCKAGLGRTGVLIGCYLMKHFRFTANEAIGYLRIVRPGSVIGPQQHFLRDMQSRMWKAGDAMRRQKSDANRNSRNYFLPPTQDSSLTTESVSSGLSFPLSAVSVTGLPSWSSIKGSSAAPRNYSINPVIRRVNTRVSESTSKCRRDPSPSNVFSSNYSQIIKDRQHALYNEEEADGGFKSNSGSHRRCHVTQHSSRSSISRDSNGHAGSGNDSFSNDSTATCAHQSQRSSPFNDSAACSADDARADTRDSQGMLRKQNMNPKQQSRDEVYTKSSSISLLHVCGNNPGILKNANMDPKYQSGELIRTQRILNAAGQPRKVVVPMSQAGKKERSLGLSNSSSPPRNMIG